MKALRSLDRKLIRDLLRIKGQALAIAVIVACGVMMMVGAMGAMNSLWESQSTYYDRYRFADIFANLTRAPMSLVDEIADIEGVHSVYPHISKGAILDIEGMVEPAAGQLVSLPDDGAPVLNDIILLKGRMPQQGRDLEALAGEAFMTVHGFEIGSRIDVTVNGFKHQITIVGIGASPEFVYTLPPGGMVPDDRRFGVFWVKQAVLENIFDLGGAFNAISLSLYTPFDSQFVIEQLDELIQPYGGTGAYKREDQLSHAFLDAELQQLATMARVMPPIFLMIAAFLLNVIMTRMIETEREQIGLLKAFGYSDYEVAQHYLKLAFFIAALGILLGYGLGTWLANFFTQIYTTLFHFPILVYRESRLGLLLASSFSLLAAGVGAANAMYQAASLSPAVAMREQPPVVYKESLWERFGSSAVFDKPTQMIFRHILRWPGRSLITVLGVAAAQGLLIGTLFSFDAIDEMIDLNFSRGAPYDAALHFIEPITTSTINEIYKLPGVISAEPARDFPVKLTKGPYKENIYITGIDEMTTMQRVLDQKLGYITVPEAGVAISVNVAHKLQITRGDTVAMEVLSGRRPDTEVTVSAIVQDYFGLPVYMDRRNMNRIMREGDVMSGVYLKLKDEALPDFYQEVKQIPAVASVTLQDVSRKTFDETLGETIYIMMNIYRLIGGAIAAGVVYNAARIAMSERARELASLRILGFSKFNVSYIMLGELLLLILIALPVGCLLGYGLAYIIANAMATDLYRIPLVIQPVTYGTTMLTILAASFVSALLVSRQINTLDLIAVLKSRD